MFIVLNKRQGTQDLKEVSIVILYEFRILRILKLPCIVKDH